MPIYTEQLSDSICGYQRRFFRQSRVGELALILGYTSFLKDPILELACGGGRVMNELAEYGHEVYGIEYSAHMLKYALEDRAWRRPEVRERIHYIQGDMTDFHLKKKFGLVIIPYHSFWYNLQADGAERCARLIIEHLSSDGRFLVETPLGTDPTPAALEKKKTWWDGMAKELDFVYHVRPYHTHFSPMINPFAGRMQIDTSEMPDAMMLEGRRPFRYN